VTAGPLAEEIPGAELRAIEGAGHLFWISHPEETVEAVAGFWFWTVAG
jgi:pimeloyl-ACP methyl ester carboxylesterase